MARTTPACRIVVCVVSTSTHLKDWNQTCLSPHPPPFYGYQVEGSDHLFAKSLSVRHQKQCKSTSVSSCFWVMFVGLFVYLFSFEDFILWCWFLCLSMFIWSFWFMGISFLHCGMSLGMEGWGQWMLSNSESMHTRWWILLLITTKVLRIFQFSAKLRSVCVCVSNSFFTYIWVWIYYNQWFQCRRPTSLKGIISLFICVWVLGIGNSCQWTVIQMEPPIPWRMGLRGGKVVSSRPNGCMCNWTIITILMNKNFENRCAIH